jgi:hypothetical protein
MWTSHFHKKNGVAYCPDPSRIHGHSHEKTLFLPSNTIIPVDKDGNRLSKISSKDLGLSSFCIKPDPAIDFIVQHLQEVLSSPYFEKYEKKYSKKIIGLHVRNTKNIGDRYCHPLDYFSFSQSPDVCLEKRCVSEIGEIKIRDPDVVILGGGAISDKANVVMDHFPNSKVVAWGIGYSKRFSYMKTDDNYHLNAQRSYSLYGTRDYYDSDIRHVACVSCMHPFFDEHLEPSHDVVVYGHSRFGDLKQQAEVAGIPYLDNESPLGFLGVVNFLASGKTIVTNSYHGAYWGTLLGRKVSMVPFGSKFFGLKYMPAVVENLEEGILKAKGFSMALEDAREENRAFYKDVCKLLWGEG